MLLAYMHQKAIADIILIFRSNIIFSSPSNETEKT